MIAPPRPTLRRIVTTALLAVAALGLLPVAANAATPAKLRLLDVDPTYSRITVTGTDGVAHSTSPGLLRLRVTPTGGTAVDRAGFCVDLKHVIGEGRDYDVRIATSADIPALASARHAEAAWLIQQAETLIAAQPTASRALEAGALQVAMWQLVGEARETSPTSDAAVNARVAALRTLAAGRAVGGPMTITPDMPRGCAGRSVVRLRVTGVPGSTATLSATGGSAVLSATQVRFAADGVATVSLSSATQGVVTVTARATGGTLARLVRASTGQTTPQETMVLTPATPYVATTTVTFDDCPVIPLETGNAQTPTTPTTPATPDQNASDGLVTPFENPSSNPTIPGPSSPRESTPHHPTQTGPRLRVRKTGPAKATAGRTIRYTIRVTNTGTEPLRGVAVEDRLPAGMSLASVPSGASLRGGRVAWTLSSLAAGATRSLSLNVRLDADITGRRCNTASARASGAARATATTCTMVRSIPRTLLPAVTG